MRFKNKKLVRVWLLCATFNLIVFALLVVAFSRMDNPGASIIDNLLKQAYNPATTFEHLNTVLNSTTINKSLYRPIPNFPSVYMCYFGIGWFTLYTTLITSTTITIIDLVKRRKKWQVKKH